MPFDPALADRMRHALADVPGAQEKKMFGGYCWMLNGNMLCGVEVGRFMFRVGKDREAEALGRPGASPMDITGKPMPGFVWVDAAHAEGDALRRWIDFAGVYVGSLPRKLRAW
jgi:hypothetical protein